MSHYDSHIETIYAAMATSQLEFMLEYQNLTADVRYEVKRELNHRYGRSAFHTGFTSLDGTLSIPVNKDKPLDWSRIVEMEKQWMESVIAHSSNLCNEIPSSYFDDKMKAMLTAAADTGLKSMYYKRSMPSAGLVPAPAGFKSVSDTAAITSALTAASKMRFNSDAVTSIIAADKDLQQITGPSWTKDSALSSIQSMSRALRDAPQRSFIDAESQFDLTKYSDFFYSKPHRIPDDLELMYPHEMKIQDYPGQLKSSFWNPEDYAEIKSLAKSMKVATVTASAP